MTDQQPSISTLHSPISNLKRPFSVTVLIVVVLIFTVLNSLRLITAIRFRVFLTTPPLDIPVVYLAITGTVWSGIGLVIVIGLWAGRKWSLYSTRFIVAAYAVYYWIDRLLVAQPHAIAARWPFAVGLMAVSLFFAFWVLSRPKAQAFLSKS